jgi:class 3 adenylate cyclase
MFRPCALGDIPGQQVRILPGLRSVVSTVLFTDIVGSTERAAMVGDEAWTAARATNCACAIRDAVHIAARIMALEGPGEVLVSGAIPPLVVGSGIAFDDRGSRERKGMPDPWPVLAVRDGSA